MATARLRRRAPSDPDDEALLHGEDGDSAAVVQGRLQLGATPPGHSTPTRLPRTEVPQGAHGDITSTMMASSSGMAPQTAPAAAAAGPAAAGFHSVASSSDAGSQASVLTGGGPSFRSLRALSLISDGSLAAPVRQPVRLAGVCPQLRILGLADNLLTNVNGEEEKQKKGLRIGKERVGRNE